MRGRAASRRQERGSLAQLRVPPPPSRARNTSTSDASSVLHSRRRRRVARNPPLTAYRAHRDEHSGRLVSRKGRSWPSASSLMRKASFAASVGAPLVTASSRRAACVRPLPAPKSGPGFGPRCASRLERAGCSVRACQKGLEPPGFGPKALSPASALHCADLHKATPFHGEIFLAPELASPNPTVKK